MAEIPMNGRVMPTTENRSFTGLVHWAGAAVSLGLVVGACVWGYQILARDVSGVPVVRAVEGPMRVQPENPGGRQAAHQGLSVNTVAAEGSAGAPADRLVLAPEPLTLKDEDMAVATTQTAVAPRVETQAISADDIVAPPPIAPEQVDDIAAFAARIAGDAPALSDTGPIESAPVKTSVAPVEDVVEVAASSGGLTRSLRPRLRPAGLGQKVAAVDASLPVSPPSEVAPTEVPPGTRMVQLGAFASREIAVQEWTKLTAKFDDYLGDKTRVIQKATSGGRVFYRLRAMGFGDVSDARRLCSALKAENAACIPVSSR